jgi:hypothetical protein
MCAQPAETTLKRCGAAPFDRSQRPGLNPITLPNSPSPQSYDAATGACVSSSEVVRLCVRVRGRRIVPPVVAGRWQWRQCPVTPTSPPPPPPLFGRPCLPVSAVAPPPLTPLHPALFSVSPAARKVLLRKSASATFSTAHVKGLGRPSFDAGCTPGPGPTSYVVTAAAEHTSGAKRQPRCAFSTAKRW